MYARRLSLRTRPEPTAGPVPSSRPSRRCSGPRWFAVLVVCWTFLSFAVSSVHAISERLNDPLVANGDVDFFLISPDGGRVV